MLNWRPVVDYELREIEYELREIEFKNREIEYELREIEFRNREIEFRNREIAYEHRMKQRQIDEKRLNELDARLAAIGSPSSTSSTPLPTTPGNSAP
jgi:hypothetical protein